MISVLCNIDKEDFKVFWKWNGVRLLNWFYIGFLEFLENLKKVF